MKTELVIPNKDNDGSDNAELIKTSITKMCGLYGGATVFQATGYWTNEGGKLYQDAVSVIVSAATNETKAMDDLTELANEVLEFTDQEAVFISVNGKAKIIE